jgi:hypothetical protein
VSITGRNFTNVTAVRFGGTCSSNFTVSSATSLSATAPPGMIGTVDASVITRSGSSPTLRRDHFKYLP